MNLNECRFGMYVKSHDGTYHTICLDGNQKGLSGALKKSFVAAEFNVEAKVLDLHASGIEMTKDSVFDCWRRYHGLSE
jgi:hypothetical protein